MSTLKSFSSQYSKINEQVSLSLTLPKTTSKSINSQFPQRQDVINRTFLTRKLKPLHSKDESEADSGDSENSQWLFPDRLSDPSFGVKGQSPKKDMIRAYRRIASSSLFVPPTSKEAGLNGLDPEQRRFGKKNYILVEESRLMELIKLDEALQKEQAKIGHQCSLIAQDYQMPVRIPLPATRYAIHHLCEEQMSRAQQEIMKLQTEWTKYCRQNHYHKPHLFLKHSYVESAPFAQKALKLRLVKEATQTWLMRKERDTMAYEDDLSFLTCLYYDSLQRQRDYERYYILATRYGPFDEQEFYQDSFPGKRYYKKVTVASLKLQLLWDRYWAMTKLRRYRAARMIQKYIRRYQIYKKLHPIIRLRLKIGKKTYYMFCWARWKEYNGLCRRVKNALQWQFTNSLQQCFFGWKTYIRKQKQERARQLESFGKKFRNLALYTTYRHWQVYTRRNKQLKLRLKRFFAFPHFDMWVEYTRWSKHLKRVNHSAIHIQCMLRKWKAKRKAVQRKEAREMVFHFSLLLLSKILVRKIRLQTLQREFVQWKPEELHRRQLRASEQERQRLQRKQVFIQDREKATLKELKKHLQSHHGLIQLKVMVEEFLVQQHQQSRQRGDSAWTGVEGASTRSTFSQLRPFSPSPNRGEEAPPLSSPLSLSLGAISRYPSSAALTTERDRPPLQSQESTISTVFSDLPLDSAAASHPHGLLAWIPFLGPSLSSREHYHQQLDQMVKRLKKACLKTVKLLEAHNYEVKYPPVLRCFHPQCAMCFLNEEQYHRHILNANEHSPHRGEKEQVLVEQRQWIESCLTELKQQLLQAKIKRQQQPPEQRVAETRSPRRQTEGSLVSETSSSLSLEALVLPESSPHHHSADGDLFSTTAEEERERLEDHLPLLFKYAYHRQSTHFHLFLRNVKAVEWFRQFYLQSEGISLLIHRLDCYLAIQEWKKFTTTQSQYYTKATSIFEMYLQEEAIRSIDLSLLLTALTPSSSSASPSSSSIASHIVGFSSSTAAMGNYLAACQRMAQKLQQLKEDDCQTFPGYLQEKMKKLTTFQIIFGVKPSNYRHWTSEGLLFPTIFQELDVLLFASLYQAFSHDRAFLLSQEYAQYLQLLEKEAEAKEDRLLEDYRQYRLHVIGNWSISFKQYEMMIAAKADQALEFVIRNQIEEIYQPIERYTVYERKVEKRHEEQSRYEEQMLLIDEAIHYTADICAEFIFDYYVKALLKAMWEVPDYRKGMLQYSGYAKFKLKKKNDVMANYEAMMSNKEKVQESKEWFNQFFNSTSQRERSLVPKDAATSWKQQSSSRGSFQSLEKATDEHHEAMKRIQKRIRGLLGRKKAKKEFAKTYKKYYDETAKAHYYYNTKTEESSWTAPSLFRKLYPKAIW